MGIIGGGFGDDPDRSYLYADDIFGKQEAVALLKQLRAHPIESVVPKELVEAVDHFIKHGRAKR